MRTSLLLLALVACGGDDAMTTPDAPGSTADAPTNAQCLIKGDYGAVGSVTGTASMGAGTLSVTLDAGPPRDVFYIKLVSGKGVFTGGIAAGTYTISGDDAGYTTCGLCVHIIADLAAPGGPAKMYFADSGTVTLTSTGSVMGSAMNLHFDEVDTGTGTVIPGCEATMTSVSFATQ